MSVAVNARKNVRSYSFRNLDTISPFNSRARRQNAQTELDACTRTIVPFSDAVAIKEPGSEAMILVSDIMMTAAREQGGQLESKAMAAMGESLDVAAAFKPELSTKLSKLVHIRERQD